MATTRIVKLRWAKKLAQAKFFVVLTDKESVIALDGVDPNSFTDILALQAQSAELDSFMEALQELKAEHERKLDELEGGPRATTRRKKVNKAKARRK